MPHQTDLKPQDFLHQSSKIICLTASCPDFLQVFGSVDEVDPIESEPKLKDEKPQPKIPNGALPNCTSSPDSGHPSSRNFSVTSGLSDCSPSTEDASTQENGSKIKLPEPSAVTSEATVDRPTNSSLKDKLKEEPAEESPLALDTGKGDLMKSSGALPPEDEMIKAQEKDKIEKEEVNRTDTVKSMDSQWDSDEKSDLNVSEAAESTTTEHSEENAKLPDSNEKSMQILQSSEVTGEEITESLEGIRQPQVVAEAQINMECDDDDDDRDKTEKSIANKETPTMCDPPKELTNECSVEEAKTTDTSPPANAEELTKSELTTVPPMEPLEKESQPPQHLSETEMSTDLHIDPSEKETKSPKPLSETEMTSDPDMDPLEKETKPPQRLSETDVSSDLHMDPSEKEKRSTQPLCETEMTSSSRMEILEKEMKPPQPLSELEMSSAPDMEPCGKEAKLPQPHSETEMTSLPDMEPTEKEMKPPQPLCESDITSGPCIEPTEKEKEPPQTLSESEIARDSHMDLLEKEIKPPRTLSESEMASSPDTEPAENEIKPPQPLYESETTSNSNVEPSEEEKELPQAFSESQDFELIMNNPSTDNPDMRTIMNWTYDSNRTKALMKQINEPLLSIMSSSKQSPDTSDDSPSALEMEEIPSALVYMPSEDILANVPVTLGPPLALTMPPEKAAVGMPALELCMEAGQNTSPEATESALSEEEPEMESLFPKPDSLAVGDHKNDVASPVSSIGTTYSVSTLVFLLECSSANARFILCSLIIAVLLHSKSF